MSNGFAGDGLNGSGSAEGDESGFENSDSAGFASPNGDGIGGVELRERRIVRRYVGWSFRSFDENGDGGGLYDWSPNFGGSEPSKRRDLDHLSFRRIVGRHFAADSSSVV